jgi:hypothetical protein
MKRILFLISFFSGFLGSVLSQSPTDITTYELLRENGMLNMHKRDFVEALISFNAATIPGRKIGRRAEIESLVKSAEDSLKSLIPRLEDARKMALDALGMAEKANTRTDSALKIADKIISNMYFYDDKFALAYNSTRYGFIDKRGNIVIDYKYERLIPFNEYTGFARGRMGKFWYLIDTTGKEYKYANYYIEPDVEHNFKAIQREFDYKIKWKSLLKCDSIEVLLLNDNKLKTVPSEIERFHSLKTLCLYFNEIESLPKELGNLTTLESVSLFNNELTVLHPDFFKLVNLRKLDLASNKLNKIPKEIEQLKNLKWLDLSFNNLEEVPDEISALENLSVLFLDNNRLKKLPEGLGKLKNLETLNVEANSYDTLPKIIGELKNLTNLGFYIPRNGFIYQEILDLPKLNLVSYMDSVVHYNLNELAKKIRISTLKKETIDARSFGNLSWYCMLAGDIEGAILAGERYLAMRGDNVGGLSNLAMGYLWSGEYHKAYGIYSKYKDKREYGLSGRLGSDIFLKDINDIESAGIRAVNTSDIKKIKAFLLEK